jgi:hypothetical protein
MKAMQMGINMTTYVKNFFLFACVVLAMEIIS